MYSLTPLQGVFWCSSEYLGNPSKTSANFSKPSPTQYFAGNAKSKTVQGDKTEKSFYNDFSLIKYEMYSKSWRAKLQKKFLEYNIGDYNKIVYHANV